MASFHDADGKEVTVSAKELVLEEIWKMMAQRSTGTLNAMYLGNEAPQFSFATFMQQIHACSQVLGTLVAGDLQMAALEAPRATPQLKATPLPVSDRANVWGDEVRRLRCSLRSVHSLTRNVLMPLRESGWLLRRQEAGWVVDLNVRSLFEPNFPSECTQDIAVIMDNQSIVSEGTTEMMFNMPCTDLEKPLVCAQQALILKDIRAKSSSLSPHESHALLYKYFSNKGVI